MTGADVLYKHRLEFERFLGAPVGADRDGTAILPQMLFPGRSGAGE